MHVPALFEASLYDGARKMVSWLSYWAWRLAHYARFRYTALITVTLMTILLAWRLGG